MQSATEILSSRFPDIGQHSVEQPQVATWQLSIKMLYTVNPITFNTATIAHTQTFTLLHSHPLHSSAFMSWLTSDFWRLQAHWVIPSWITQCPCNTGVIVVGVLLPLFTPPLAPFTSRLLHSLRSLLHSVLRCLTAASQLITGSWLGRSGPRLSVLGWASISCSSKCTAYMVEIRVSHYCKCVGRDFQGLQLDLHSL